MLVRRSVLIISFFLISQIAFAARVDITPAGSSLATPVSVTNGGTHANLSATGGTAQVVKQASSGADFTVAVLGSTEIPQRHNILFNGGGWFFQRQTPGTLTTIADDTYGPDRWNILTQTGTIQTNRTAGNTAEYAIDLKQTQASAQRMGMEQIIESHDSIPMRGRTLRFQFNAKCSTNTTVRYAIVEWTGTADSVTSDIVNSWTSTTYTASNFFIANTTATTATTAVTTSWTACSVSAAVSASCNNLIVFIWTDGTAAQNVTMELGEIMLCDANLARDWIPEKYCDELIRCQRYYQKAWEPDTIPGTTWSGGTDKDCLVVASSSVGLNWNAALTVTMRKTPTVTFYDHLGNAGVMSAFSAGSWTGSITINSSIATPTHIGAYTSTTTYQGINFAYTADAEL